MFGGTLWKPPALRLPRLLNLIQRFLRRFQRRLVRAPALGAVMWGCMPAVGVLELCFACTMAEPLLVRLRLIVNVTQVLCSQ